MSYRLLLLLAALMMLTTAVLGQNQWNITGAGARAEGMGGAFIGLADDATAIAWNPAGLGQLERTEFSAVGRWLQENYNWEYKPTTGTSSTSQENPAHFAYNFASIAFPLHAGRVTIVPAVAYQTQLDFYYKYNDLTTSEENTGGGNAITPGIGIKLHPMFYIGGAVNIWIGDYDLKSTETYSPRSSSGSTTNGSVSGLNFNAGFIVDFEGMKKPIPIKIGATIRTPFDLKLEGDYEYLQNNVATTKGKFSNTVQMPLMFGVGASARIVENLTLSFDFETRRYGDSKLYYTTDGKAIDTVNMSDSKSDLNQIRVGAEYLIVTSSVVIPVRAGFRTEPTMMANWDGINSKYTDQVSGTGFTVGTGLISKAFALDVTYSRATAQRTGTYTGGKATEDFTFQVVSTSLIIYF
jgi:long-subunit fatty acid transport protein